MGCGVVTVLLYIPKASGASWLLVFSGQTRPLVVTDRRAKGAIPGDSQWEVGLDEEEGSLSGLLVVFLEDLLPGHPCIPSSNSRALADVTPKTCTLDSCGKL